MKTKLLLFSLMFSAFFFIVKSEVLAEAVEGYPGTCSVEDWVGGVCQEVSTCSPKLCAKIDDKEFWCNPHCEASCSGIAYCDCSCDGGSGPARSYNPVCLSSEASGDNQITITWQKKDQWAHYYRISRCEFEGQLGKLCPVIAQGVGCDANSGGICSYTYTESDMSKDYWYYIEKMFRDDDPPTWSDKTEDCHFEGVTPTPTPTPTPIPPEEENNPPFCSSLSVTGQGAVLNPDGSVTIDSGSVVNISASGISDLDGEADLSRVEFSFKNQSQTSCVTSGGVIGTDQSASGGWSTSWDTTNIAAGDYYVFATVYDQQTGCSGDPAATGANSYCSSGADCRQCHALIHIIEEVPGSISGRVYLNSTDSTCNQGVEVSRSVNIRQAGGAWSCNLTSNSAGNFTTSGNCSTDPALDASYIITAAPHSGELVACEGSAILTSYNPNATNANVTLALQASNWFQSVEGDAHAGGNVSSSVPSGEFFSLDGEGNTPGVVSYGSGFSGFNSSSVSSTGWLANTSFSKKGFSWFYSIFGAPETVNFNGTLPSSGTGVEIYYAKGEVRINDPVSITNGRKVIILIDNDTLTNPGNLVINGDIAVEEGGFLMAVVRGNISLSGNVSNLEGIFVSDENFSTGTGNTALLAQGSFIASSFSLQRELSAGLSLDPAEVFEFRSDFFFSFPYEYITSSYIWEELAP